MVSTRDEIAKYPKWAIFYYYTGGLLVQCKLTCLLCRLSRVQFDSVICIAIWNINLDCIYLWTVYSYIDLETPLTSSQPQKTKANTFLHSFSYDQEGEQLLKQLSRINRPFEITFQQMNKLMSQCELVDRRTRTVRSNTDTSTDGTESSQASTNVTKPSTIFSNFQFQLPKTWPGTKWCGSGDMARDFHDLGTEYEMDMCCRTHDHCPKKIRAYVERYNVTNNSLYSK